MNHSKSNLAIAGRFLPLAFVVAAGVTFATPSLAASNSSGPRLDQSTPLHADSAASAGTSASLDDHPVPPKPKPTPHHRRGHHRQHPPHPAGK
jgi:hypothetical protein